MTEANVACIPAVRREDGERVWTAGRVVYTSLMVFNLLSFVWLLATGSGIPMHPVIWFARLAAVPLAISVGKLWKDKGFWILAAYTLLISLRVFIPNPDAMFHREASENILSALWLFTGCYGLGRILDRRQLKGVLMLCACVWIVAVAVCSCIGIHAAWTGTRIPCLGSADNYFGLYRARLRVIYLSTTSGSFLGITLLIGSIIFCCVRNRAVRILLIAAMLPIILALALTDSRTAFISAPAGFGVMTFSGVFRFVRNRTEKDGSGERKTDRKAWILGIVAMLLVFGILILVFLQITPLYNQVHNRGGLISAAYAAGEEGEETLDVVTRGFGGDNVLHGRGKLWTRVFKYIGKHPLSLLIGESKVRPTAGFNQFFAHCHSVYIQVLLESGIPGLLLLLLFIVYTAVHAVRIVRDPAQPLWIRLLPALPASLWVGDIVECFTWLRSSQCPMNAILLVSAGILCAAAPKKPAKSRDKG